MNIGGILSDSAIRQAVECGDIEIDPFDPVRLNPVSYDLTLGREVACHVVDRLDVKIEPLVSRFMMSSNEGTVLEPGIGYAHRANTLPHDRRRSRQALRRQLHGRGGDGAGGVEGVEAIPMNTTWTFPFEAGALIRKRVLFELRSGAIELGLSFDVIDDGGWISTKYNVRVEGSTEAVEQYKRAIIPWMRNLEVEAKQ